MKEFWNTLSLVTLVGSGHIACEHGTEYSCDIQVSQLWNGNFMAYISNIGVHSIYVMEWMNGHHQFDFKGLLRDGSELVVTNLHTVSYTRSAYSDAVVYEASLAGGSVKVVSLENKHKSVTTVVCEVTNLVLSFDMELPNVNLSDGYSSRIFLKRLPSYNEKRQLMRVFKTSSVLSSIHIDVPETHTPEQLGLSVDALCSLLSFAQRTHIQWTAQHWFDAEGKIIQSQYRDPYFYESVRTQHLIPESSLVSFVEQSFVRFLEAYWSWRLGYAFDYYLRAMALTSVWPQSLMFFTALDSLRQGFVDQQEMMGKNRALYEKRSRFAKIRREIRAILIKESPIFKEILNPEEDSENTSVESEKAALTNKINDINRRAYQVVLKEMFVSLDLRYDDSTMQALIGLRNSIIHTGRPQQTNHIGSRQATDFAYLVESVIFAILGYRGEHVPYNQTRIFEDDT